MNDLISRKAAIDAVSRGCFELRGIFQIIKEEIEALPSAQPEQRWIPVSERLPEHNGRYLVTNTAWGRYTVDWNLWMDGEWLYPGNPIAWMPGPKAYQEDKK